MIESARLPRYMSKMQQMLTEVSEIRRMTFSYWKKIKRNPVVIWFYTASQTLIKSRNFSPQSTPTRHLTFEQAPLSVFRFRIWARPLRLWRLRRRWSTSTRRSRCPDRVPRRLSKTSQMCQLNITLHDVIITDGLKDATHPIVTVERASTDS